MSYQLERDETPADGTRRVAREQLGKALGELEKIVGAEAGTAVHGTRKHIKKYARGSGSFGTRSARKFSRRTIAGCGTWHARSQARGMPR